MYNMKNAKLENSHLFVLPDVEQKNKPTSFISDFDLVFDIRQSYSVRGCFKSDPKTSSECVVINHFYPGEAE